MLHDPCPHKHSALNLSCLNKGHDDDVDDKHPVLQWGGKEKFWNISVDNQQIE